jgi:hypothetical protein
VRFARERDAKERVGLHSTADELRRARQFRAIAFRCPHWYRNRGMSGDVEELRQPKHQAADGL